MKQEYTITVYTENQIGMINQEKIGKEFKVLIDKKEAGRYLGRTEFDSVEVDNEVIIHSKEKLPIGDFVNVKITKAYDYDLEGDRVSGGRGVQVVDLGRQVHGEDFGAAPPATTALTAEDAAAARGA